MILFFCSLFTNPIEAQWYSRSCGVVNLTSINSEEYDCLSEKVSKIILTGKVSCIVGTSLILAGGITMIASDPCCSSGNYMYGSLAIVCGLAIDVIGIPIWVVGASRKKNLKASQVNSVVQSSSFQLAPGLIYSPVLSRQTIGITASLSF